MIVGRVIGERSQLGSGPDHGRGAASPLATLTGSLGACRVRTLPHPAPIDQRLGHRAFTPATRVRVPLGAP